jgi:hypothetical protein
MNYTDAVRLFSIYFTQRVADLSQLNTHSFSNGFLRNTSANKNNLDAYEFIRNKIGQEINLDLKSFLTFSYAMFNDYSNDKENFDNLHMVKENNSIFKFLSSLISFKQRDEVDNLDETLRNQLMVIHFNLSNKFTSSQDFMSNIIADKVNDHLSHSQRNLNINTLNNSNTGPTRLDNVINNNKKDFVLIRKLINKKLRYENHLVINQMHTDAQTTSKSLFYENFPTPLFQDCAIFVEKHNEIIRTCQTEMMSLIKSTLTERIQKCTNEILKYEDSSLDQTKYSEFLPNDIVKSIIKNEERFLMDTFIRNKARANRCVAKPYEVLDQNTRHNRSSRSNMSFRTNTSVRSNSSSRNNINWSNRNSYHTYQNSSPYNNPNNRYTNNNNNFKQNSYNNYHNQNPTNHNNNNNHRSSNNNFNHQPNNQNNNNNRQRYNNPQNRHNSQPNNFNNQRYNNNKFLY